MKDRLILVYDSDSGIIGDIKYVVGKLRGNDSCSLCDITYGIREKREWKACKTRLGVDVEACYRDQVSGELADVLDGQFPSVVAQVGGEYRLLLGPAELLGCAGSVETLEARLEERWPF